MRNGSLSSIALLVLAVAFAVSLFFRNNEYVLRLLHYVYAGLSVISFNYIVVNLKHDDNAIVVVRAIAIAIIIIAIGVMIW